ncbi:MAG: leucyl aminopeptidase [Propionibacteriaceae bacterium]|nr:leucyl aminopeptidase [Propionibacteriaceae bacterium]
MICSLPSIELTSSIGSDVAGLVIGLANAGGEERRVGLPDEFQTGWQDTFNKSVLEVAKAVGAKTEPGNVGTFIAPGGLLVLATGIGNADANPEMVRRGVGTALQAVVKLPDAAGLTVTLSLGSVDPNVIKAAVEGALLGAYQYQCKAEPAVAQIQIVSAVEASTQAAIDAGCLTAAAVCQGRDWINLPANELYPQSFVAMVEQAAKDVPVEITVWDEVMLAEAGFGGIIAVGSGSARQPRLLKVSYSPPDAKQQLVLVGKGVTFDSGGLNLKPADSMYTMRHDMAGAASVIAAVLAIAKLGVATKVIAYGAMAENMPSGTAFRPSDVIQMYSGKTVENANSDAEGRLLLADVLAKSGEDAPDLLLDVATLTGACIVALGERVGGLMTSDAETAEEILTAAAVAGELLWQLPIPEETKDKLKSKVADIKSSGDRYGGALSAAAFLSEFVPADTNWAHLDIAGPAFNTHAGYNYVTEGATGMSIRTLIEVAKALETGK